MKIEELGLSVRPYHVLKRNGIDTVEQLLQLSDEQLMLFRNMGRHSLAEIREKVALVKTKTYADRIRAMNDEELTDAIYQLIYAMDPATWFCKGKKECGELLDADKEIPNEMCKNCLLEKLRQPAEEDFP